MAINLVDVSNFDDPIVAPEDGVDLQFATTVEVGLQGLANRTRFLLNELAGIQSSRQFSGSITRVSQGLSILDPVPTALSGVNNRIGGDYFVLVPQNKRLVLKSITFNANPTFTEVKLSAEGDATVDYILSGTLSFEDSPDFQLAAPNISTDQPVKLRLVAEVPFDQGIDHMAWWFQVAIED